MTKLLILPEAFQDAADAADWYEDRKSGLGDQFLNRLRASFEFNRG